MQLGMNSIGGSSVAAVVADGRRAEQEGFAIYSMANISGLDAINTLTVAGAQTERIRFVTAVVPTYPRHPASMAQQALTAASASNGRFTLGIGLSHRVVIEGAYGMSFDKPARHMREYLSILAPILHGEQVEVEGDQYTFRGAISVPSATPVPLAIAAMGPAMLRLAGERCDGTILWMTTAKAIAEHVVPKLNEAASAAGRPAPQVIVSLPIALTSDVEGARERAAREFQVYGQLPSYRAMLDASGHAGPADAAILGDEATLERSLRELAEAGTTHFNATCFASDESAVERTRAFLASLTGQWNKG